MEKATPLHSIQSPDSWLLLFFGGSGLKWRNGVEWIAKVLNTFLNEMRSGDELNGGKRASSLQKVLYNTL